MHFFFSTSILAPIQPNGAPAAAAPTLLNPPAPVSPAASDSLRSDSGFGSNYEGHLAQTAGQ